MSLLVNNLIQKQCRLMAMNMNHSRAASNFTMTPVQDYTTKKEFWNKNRELNRPTSPHLSVYKIQLTSTLSILHRATGAGTGVAFYAGAIGLPLCTTMSFPEVVHLIQDAAPSFLIVATKTAIGGSLIYHTLNGVRHLFWDYGYGFKLRELYLSGYVVVALTALGTGYVFIKS